METFFYKIYAQTLNEPVFWFCALSGSGFFIIQVILNFIGADQSTDIDDGTIEIDTGNFKWLSKQALTGFLLMFGWVGLTCRKEFILSFPLSALIATGAGIVSMFFIGWIFKIAKKLKSTGTVFNIENAIGKDALVYQRIPKGGVGKVSLSLQNFTYEIDAISHAQEDLPSFISVRVVQKLNDNKVIVMPNK